LVLFPSLISSIAELRAAGSIRLILPVPTQPQLAPPLSMATPQSLPLPPLMRVISLMVAR
jgi:hypothetical protein